MDLKTIPSDYFFDTSINGKDIKLESTDFSREGEKKEESNDEESNDTITRIGQLVKHFILTTGIAGVLDIAGGNGPHYRHRPHYMFKLIWACVWLICWVLFVHQMTQLYFKFKSNPILVDLQIRSQQSIEFPAVTVCNMNKMKKSKIKGSSNYLELSEMDSRTSTDFKNEVRKETNVKTNGNCADGLWRCLDYSKCLLLDWLCDGIEDCNDKSDEKNCFERKESTYCVIGYIQCNNSTQCIQSTQICDGIKDCPEDGWDELNCTSRTPSCGENIQIDVHQKTYQLKSPNFPKDYGVNLDCEWKIEVTSGKFPKLTFQQFDIETFSDCTNDYLQITEQPKTAFPSNKLCGNNIPTPITLSTNSAKVVFHSDSFIGRSGFEILVEEIGCFYI